MRTALRLFAAWAVLFSLLSVSEAQRPTGKKRPRRPPDRLKQGDEAPDFTLKSTDGKKTVKLSSFEGQKPVALIFGSYT